MHLTVPYHSTNNVYLFPMFEDIILNYVKIYVLYAAKIAFYSNFMHKTFYMVHFMNFKEKVTIGS